MKERPIIMTAESVRAILDGRKTQTRRVIKPQPVLGKPWRVLKTQPGWIIDPEKMDLPTAYCPYGIPGDRLWVREAWQALVPQTVCWGPGEDDWDWGAEEFDGKPSQLSQDFSTLCYKTDDPDACKWWQTPIFMPRWASRLTLDIVKIRVERLTDISHADAQAEGVEPVWIDDFGYDYRAGFSMAWDGINFKRGYAWSSNPWVWTIEFERVESER